MRRGLRFYLIGGTALLTLAGCGRGVMQFGGERESWRAEAEAQCMKSGAVKESVAVVRIAPIEGPGMCGAEFPLKVAALGEGTAMSYGDELRPPGSIPDGQMPRWPVNDNRYAEPPQTRPAYQAPADAPMSLNAPGVEDNEEDDDAPPSPPSPRASAGPSSSSSGWTRVNGPNDVPNYPQRAPQAQPPQPQYQPPQQRPQYNAPPQYQPPQQPQSLSSMPRAQTPRRDDIPDDAILPERSRATPLSPARQSYLPPPDSPSLAPPAPRPALGPIRTAGLSKAAVTPPATLACPMVSALDQWVTEAVQPAAMKWFKQPVVEIKQISAYSCRGMVGSSSGHISEHAFGNALDVAGFVLADGSKIMVQNGWTGTPEETGFLHDVQLAACERFTTVLAPGYNAAHYNHMHLDLMRRASGRRACKPYAMTGEEAALKMSNRYARRGDPGVTGSIGKPPPARTVASKPTHWPLVAGEDGYDDDDDED